MTDSIAIYRVKKKEYINNLGIGLSKMMVRKIIGRENYTCTQYNGRPILENEVANELIRKKIVQGKPFVASRFGDGELRSIVCYLNRVYGLSDKYPEYLRVAISKNAGFFPADDKNIDAFGELMLKSCNEVDILAVWFNLLEDFVYKSFGPSNGTCVYLKALEPFWFSFPWTSALEGKNVLIIHPFTDTIRSQFEKRDILFANKQVLPNFNLKLLKAVQSIGGNSEHFDTWFKALDWMFEEAMKIDFDIAIIGCGAYGMPLAVRIKQAGKMAIHMGGVTQFLFGIKGARWDVRPEYRAFYNEQWCRASAGETPQVANQIENGCYW